jgi:UDP-N-acetylmuramate--alanine ligase
MKVHFIGIGGIGISALAQYYLLKGHEVSGSDLVLSEITDALEKKGIKIFQGNSEKNVAEDVDLVIYSPAVTYENLEFRKARDTGAKLQSYPEALGELTKEYYTIAISGSHGKSTTTAMIGLVLTKAGLDPTVIVGTKVKEFGDSNFRLGKSKFLVIEACEYDASFLNYSPKIVVVTNVDKEHLDYFKNFENVKKAFNDFALKLPEEGLLVSNLDDKEAPRFKDAAFKSEYYSLKQKEATKLKKLLKVPGTHNISNALGVLAVARFLGVPDKTIFDALSKFQGTWRRFEVKNGKAGKKSIIVISDYAHHPNEIAATLKAAKEKYAKSKGKALGGRRKIWCVFQPHQHQRTYYLFDDFVETFRSAPVDKVIITDIYDVTGRETKEINEEVNSKKLVEKIGKKKVIYLPLDKIEELILKNIKPKDVLIVMGAGDIYKFADKF